MSIGQPRNATPTYAEGGHFNQLSPAEDERLAIAAEELAEAIQVICKIQRHGYESRNPDRLGDGTNRRQLTEELGHVCAAIDLLCAGPYDIDAAAMHQYRMAKLQKLKTWTHHQPADRFTPTV